MSRQDRKKASDVFRESQPVFGQKVSFDEAFPQIADVRVEVQESGSALIRERVYTKQHFPGEYVDCSNPLCYNGGFSIGTILHQMVGKRQTELETSQMCRGNEGSPKGKRIYRKCTNFFKIKVSITYKDEAQ